ncbi:TetR family transcriptional regulator [Sporosarcina sp. NCCP-2222]|uniref:TetR/AcrR family transcriptional regulator n=1 Tax=Sporosarcina sp. NCCP-2222 TaxID=2935073 RepID=UPI002087549E|nr:TetR/AcrR family transcriptional regulator [Sporosarcina sp. NCCP-2222]GKV56784.1 TetR family transcriptional regulator [Sporosarcina sp. NCCP-2222]
MREKLQHAVLELIAEKGLKFTISDIAAKLAISKRTFYEHFHSKQHIIETIVDEAIEEVKQRERSIFQRKDWSCEQKLKAILLIVPSGLQVGDAVLLDQMKRFAPNEWVKIEKLLQDEWETVREIIEIGIHNEEFRPVDVPSVLQVLKGSSMAIFDPEFLAYSKKSLAEVVQSMVDFVMHGIINRKG